MAKNIHVLKFIDWINRRAKLNYNSKVSTFFVISSNCGIVGTAATGVRLGGGSFAPFLLTCTWKFGRVGKGGEDCKSYMVHKQNVQDVHRL